MRPSGDSSLVTNEAARLLAGRVYLASNQQQEEHMDNEGMQQLKKEEKVRKAVRKVTISMHNLTDQLKRLERETTELERLCR